MSEARATSPRVTVLPATRNRFTTAPIASVQKRRVAAYARVSTDSDEQLTSYEAQVDYYTHYIKERSGVEQVVYEREYQGMTERFTELEKRLKGIEAECDRRRIQRSALIGFLKAVKSTKAPIRLLLASE